MTGQGCSLGPETFFKCLGLGHFLGGLVSNRKPNVSVSEPKVSFTSDIF
jgi:hypothetical protein